MYKHIGKIFFLGLLAALWLAGCKKESFEKPVNAAFTLEAVSDTVFWGAKFKLSIIKTPDIRSLNVSLVSVDNSKEVFKDTLTDTTDSYLLSKEITVPADGSWAGKYILKLTASSVNGKAETDTVYFKKGVANYYLVGGSSSAGWDPVAGIKFAVFTKDAKPFYDYYGYLTNAGDGLKILPGNVNWDGGFGMKPGTPGVLTNAADAANIPVSADGFYRLRLDMTDLTKPGYVLVPSNWGIIGDATAGGWDNSTAMTFAPGKGNYQWTITATLTAGSFKFRENNAWDVNLGVDANTALKYDGDNVSVTAGTYTITLNLAPAGYTYSIQKK
ncbi:SusF/SusE family outer membrane protein [Filimonas effusa]|uniref:SusF/SusE family outer membrane protein n=1 Tax=Filimonas effusa TaxID=2508721 RepID=A0A4Q1D895_9BACT|nr:SusF/SusE family outer membrane protein [Filimonas effusa]RXK85410.1 SusF/SusE family outer membrane protein [Filimonas effusa]